MIRVIYDGDHDGPTNMAQDLALLDDLPNHSISARVYGWTSPWVTLGRFQSPQKALLLGCPIPSVPRPTGGKAVLHGHDVTLGLAASLDHLKISERNLKPAYRAVIRPLVVALNAVGIPAILGEDLLRPSGHPEPPSSVRGAKDLNTQAPAEVIRGTTVLSGRSMGFHPERSQGISPTSPLTPQSVPPTPHRQLESQTHQNEGRPKTEDCFAHVSPNDIVAPQTGQKICGCALRMYPNAILLQASIPIAEPLVDPATVYKNPSTLPPSPPFNPTDFQQHLLIALGESLSRS